MASPEPFYPPVAAAASVAQRSRPPAEWLRHRRDSSVADPLRGTHKQADYRKVKKSLGPVLSRISGVPFHDFSQLSRSPSK